MFSAAMENVRHRSFPPKRELIEIKLINLDIDTKSLEYASKNIISNSLDNRIVLQQTIPEDPLLPLNILQISKYLPLVLALSPLSPLYSFSLHVHNLMSDVSLDFCMCNPPFYTDTNELYQHAREKSLEPFSVTPPAAVSFISLSPFTSANIPFPL